MSGKEVAETRASAWNRETRMTRYAARIVVTMHLARAVASLRAAHALLWEAGLSAAAEYAFAIDAESIERQRATLRRSCRAAPRMRVVCADVMGCEVATWTGPAVEMPDVVRDWTRAGWHVEASFCHGPPAPRGGVRWGVQ